MLESLLPTLLVGAVVAAIAAAAVMGLLKERKKGDSCGCGCGSCPNAQHCHNKDKL